MRRLLPDTQILLWLANGAKELPREAEKLVLDDDNELFFSLASLLEVSIKAALRRPDFNVNPRGFRRGLLDFGFSELAITSEHVTAVATLPLIHRDPFDRLLVVQAELEGLTLMTTDKKLAQYGPHVRKF